MSVKMVIGSIAKQPLEVKAQADAALQQTQKSQGAVSANVPPTVSQQLARATQTNEAVVTTLRAFRATTSGDPIKDPSKAEKLASKVSDEIRNKKEEALGAHDGVSSDKTSPVLVN